MMTRSLRIVALATSLLPSAVSAAPQLLAIGNLNDAFDLSGLSGNLESGVAANVLGGMGSALAWAGGNTFLALPDRGPNANPWNSNVDDTTSYIARFQSVTMSLQPNSTNSFLPGPTGGNLTTTPLPMVLTPTLSGTTLLWSDTALTYGAANGALGLPSGTPAANTAGRYFFTGRSDGFAPGSTSADSSAARLDPEGARVSPDGSKIYVSDEYGPYVYQFDRATGQRLRSYAMPANLIASNLSSQGATEISGNTVGRVANKGMEGLAITPDGKTLVGIIQAPLEQDAAAAATSKILRIVTVDVASGATHEYAYSLHAGSGVSEIIALNDHEFLIDERDGKGRLGGNNNTSNAAAEKKLYKISLTGAQELLDSDTPTQIAGKAVASSQFLDVVSLLTGAGIGAKNIPSKIEGLAFGDDVDVNGTTMHTLWIANDNDFIPVTSDNPALPNTNQFYVVGFTANDLGGSTFAPEQVPEPATMGLFGLGLLGLAGLRRKR